MSRLLDQESDEELVDREEEASRLRTLADAGGLRLALVYGRRRVGKTWLLARLWPRERAFHFTASATSPEINRRVLIEEAARWSGEDLRPEDHPTWRSVFRALFSLGRDRPIVVVIDEVQYLALDTQGLREITSELNSVVEGPPLRAAGLLVVLSGSAVGTLAALTDGGSPLYGRLDLVLKLEPFDYLNAGKMVPAYAPADRVRTYAAFGGLPQHLSLVDDDRPLGENIVDLLLDPTGRVRLQVETALSQEEGLRELARYQAVLQSVGVKRRTLGEIAANLGQKLDTPLRRMVHHLVDLGFLAEERDFDAPKNRARRYRMADPSFAFHYGMTLPNESAIAISGAESVWAERLSPEAFPTWVGQQVFEDIVDQAWRRRARAKAVPAVLDWGRYAGKDRLGRDLEIDHVARLLDGRILTGSSKFRRRRADATVLLEHVDALRRLADSGLAWAAEALDEKAPMLFASASGFKASFREAARDLGREVTTWDLEDLFS